MVVASAITAALEFGHPAYLAKVNINMHDEIYINNASNILFIFYSLFIFL